MPRWENTESESWAASRVGGRASVLRSCWRVMRRERCRDQGLRGSGDAL